MAIQIAQQNETTAAKSPTVETNGHHSHDQQQAMRNGEDLLRQLADAADAGDEQAFILAYRSIDWTRATAGDFLQAIQWAFAAGAHLAARQLATQGAEQNPENAELQKAARILAPPKVLRRNLPANPVQHLNREWLSKNRLAYLGQWVAIRNGELLAHGDSLKTITNTCEIRTDTLFTRVF